MRPQPAIFGEAAMHGLADEAALDPVDRIADDAVADPPALDPRAERGDLAGDIEPHDRRHRDADARHAAAGEDIVVIERGRPHPHDDIAFAGDRIGEIALQPRPFGAVLAQYQGLHSPTPSDWLQNHRASFETRLRRSSE